MDEETHQLFTSANLDVIHVDVTASQSTLLSEPNQAQHAAKNIQSPNQNQFPNLAYDVQAGSQNCVQISSDAVNITQNMDENTNTAHNTSMHKST